MKGKRPNKSIRIKILCDKSFDYHLSEEYYLVKNDNRILSMMEVKMRLIYNENSRSLYHPTEKELSVIERNLRPLVAKASGTYGLMATMITHIHNEISSGTVPGNGYNKRALIPLIDVIKNHWLSEYPSFVYKVDNGGDKND